MIGQTVSHCRVPEKIGCGGLGKRIGTGTSRQQRLRLFSTLQFNIRGRAKRALECACLATAFSSRL